MINDDKVFYNPGDLVIVRHDSLDNKPVMYVVEKITRSIMTKDGDKDNVFVGIKCRWFDNNTVLREAIFSTKDLTHYNG